MKSILFILIGCLVFWDSTEASFKERDKILYKDLGKLYFSPGEKTRARRTYSVPQLQCQSGCHYPQPKFVECTNAGWDGSSNSWKCKATLDAEYALHNVEVVCEGYSRPDDRYVTVGSCSLEYSIKPRSKGIGCDAGCVLYIIFVCCALCFVLFVCCALCLIMYVARKKTAENTQQKSSSNDDRGQQPPMGWNIPGMNQRYSSASAPPFEFGQNTNKCGNDEDLRGDGGAGGFWTGLATGGVLGYLLGGNHNERRKESPFASSSCESEQETSWRASGHRRKSPARESSPDRLAESVATARYRQR